MVSVCNAFQMPWHLNLAKLIASGRSMEDDIV